MHEGEIIELLQRNDIHLGERRELGLGVDAVLVGIEALHRHGGVQLIEGPGVANADDLAIGAEHDFRADRGPDVRMGMGIPRKTG